MRVVLHVGLAALAYFASARLGYLFAIPRGTVTLWPPAGVMLALLALSPRRDWPALLAGGFVGSLASDARAGYSVVFGILVAAANLGESLLAAWFVTRRLGQPVRLSSVRSVLEFTLGTAILTNSLTACLGALVINRGFQPSLGRAWLIWWVSDGLGMLLVAPVIVTWADTVVVQARRMSPRRLLEAIILVVAVVVVANFTLGPTSGWIVQPGRFATFPLLLWAALRFGPAGAATCSLIIAGVTTWNAARGHGPFVAVGSSGLQTAVQAYAFLTVASLTAMIAAAVLEERKSAERRLVESEARYRTVLDAATDVIVTIDTQSRILLANPAVERVFGYTPAEIIGEKMTNLMPARLREQHEAGFARYLATGRKHIEWKSVFLTGLHKDGREIPLEVSFGELAGDGHHVFTGILRDISEKLAAERALHAAEERMRFALDASRVGLWEVEFATGRAYWSPTLESLHGLEQGSFGATLVAFLQHIHPDDRASVQEEIDRATRQHADSNILYRTIWPDGTIHWLSGVGRTFYDADGTPVRAAGIGLDVTERRVLEEQYRQSQKMEAIGQLAGGIAHDFNNILTAIQGYGALMAQAMPPDSPHQEDIAEILRAADRAASLTRQLLAFSRRQILAPAVLNLSESLIAIEPMLRRLIGEDIAVMVRAPADIWPVIADAGQMEQVILNLALNARDAMPQGGTLSLELSNVELDDAYEHAHGGTHAGPYVRFAATDTGVGMTPAVAARVFEPFFTTKGQGEGTGLGLSTVYGIVKQTGGSVEIDSEPGRGSIFKVYLPRADAPIETAPALSPTQTRAGSETILVVDDEEVLRRLVRRVLERQGYDVLTAGTPGEAITMAAEHADRIRLLLTDVVLPEMSGSALAAQLETQHPALKVLFMSGYTDDAIVRRGVMEHKTNFIQKPFRHDELLQAVRDTLDAPA